MPNPVRPIPENQLVGDLATSFVRNSRRIYTPLESAITRMPDLARRVSNLGGIRQVATTDPLSAQTREILPILTSIETSCFLENFTEGDIYNSPSAQTLNAGIDRTINIGTDILDHLQECCEAIKSKLEALKSLIKRSTDNILDNQDQMYRKLTSTIENLGNYLVEFYSKEKEVFLEGLETEKTNVYDNIRLIIREELQPINDNITRLENKIDALEGKLNRMEGMIQALQEKLDRSVLLIQEQLGKLVTCTWDTWLIVCEILAAVGELALIINPYIPTSYVFQKECQAALAGIVWLIVRLGNAFGAFASDYKGFTKALVSNSESNVKSFTKEQVISCESVVKDFTEEQVKSCESVVNNFTKDQISELDKFLRDTKKGFPCILTNEVCTNIVGESYAKWDSVCSYFPTIIFLFTESTVFNKKRRSQIKLRLKQTSAEITDQNIQEIIKRIKKIGTVNYTYGTCKGNYVSSDKRFKTAVNGVNRDSIVTLLKSIFFVVDEVFDSELLSTTEIGKKRDSITKRETDLWGFKGNTVNYQQNFPLKLNRVNLLVNGVSSIIKLTG